MDPVTIGLLASTALSAGSAINNTIQSRKLARAKRPTYNINPEAQENVDTAENLAIGDSIQAQTARDAAKQNAADMVQANIAVNGANPMAVMSGVNMAQTETNKAMRDITAQEAERKMMASRLAMDARSAMIDEKDKAFEYNENAPYQLKIQEARLRRKQAREDAQAAIKMGSSLGQSAGGSGGGGGGSMSPEMLKMLIAGG